MRSQKELKADYIEELKKMWRDEKMVEHCSKTTAYVIEHDGKLYDIEKPKIETDFCFGYGMNGVSNTDDYNEAATAAENAKRNREYFINQNLENINRWIENLSDILENLKRGDYQRYVIKTGKKYYRQSDDCKLAGYSIADALAGKNSDEMCSDIELLEKLIAGYEQVKADFEKRLNAYLKRYGMSKVRTWSYLVD